MTGGGTTTAPPRWMKVGIPAAVIVLLAAGGWFTRAGEEDYRENVEARLMSIAKLKAKQVHDWRAERLADAAVLIHQRPLLQDIAQFLSAPSESAASTIDDSLRPIMELYHYSDILLADLQGRVRLNLNAQPAAVQEVQGPWLHAAVAARRPLWTPLHEGTEIQFLHLSVVAPLFVESRHVGALLLVTDGSRFLYPLIQSWPTPSETAETLLVRQDGEDVLFLNELRHQTGTALALRIPASRSDLPAAMAVAGERGIVYGEDYRGVDVVAAILPILDSNWFMVAKIDASEAFADWRARSLLVMLLMVGLGGLVGLVGRLVWERNLKTHFRALYRSETALREALQLNESIVDSSPIGIIIYDSSGDCIAANDAVARMLGASRDQVLHQNMHEIESWRESALHAVALNALEHKQRKRHTAQLTTSFGKAGFFEIHFVPIEVGTELHLLLMVGDITESKRAEEQLRQEKDKAQKYLDVAGTMFIALDDTGRVTLTNRKGSEIFGHPQDEIVGKDWFTAFLPERVQNDVRAVFARLMAGEIAPFEYYENPVVTRSGEERIIAWHNALLRDVKGRNVGMLSSGADVTERRLAESALSESEEKYRLLIENAEVLVSLFNRDGECLLMNRKAAAWLGGEPAQFLGKSFRELHPADDAEDYIRRIRAVVDSGVVQDFEDIARFPRGERHLLSNVQPVRDASGRVHAVQIVSHDVTELRRLEDQLLQSQKMEAVGRLAGGVAHDFNNMLGIILGHTELLLSSALPEDPWLADLTEIEKAAQRSADLTRQLLAFASKQPITPKVLDLNATVEGMLKMLRRLIGENIDLRWQPATDAWPVRMDPAQVDQVLANLCVNARDAISGLGRITIETRNVVLDEEYCANQVGMIPGEYVLLTVIDNGSGMDAQTLSHVFEPFFTTKDIGEGTGLGLATVYGIATQNNGFVNVYSEPRKGTSVKIYLPRDHHQTAPEAPAAAPELARGSGESVLVVEDEPGLLRSIAKMLEMLGYSVIAAPSAARALEVAERKEVSVDLLLTDVVMPDMSGAQLAERLSAIRPGLKILFMSGYTAEAVAHHGALDEGVHFVQKPCSMASLATHVRDALQG